MIVGHSPPTSEVCGSKPGPYSGKAGSCLPLPRQFTVQNRDQLVCALDSSTLKEIYPSWL